ncbi:MAG: hypothetical protein K9L28_05650 [Synergistales bacterium]|nr:hypothetical protein [Synergistales bacterium]
MLERLETMEQLVEKVQQRMHGFAQRCDKLESELEENKKQLQNKDLELIRLRKEHQRLVEQKEREAMQLKKERKQAQEKLQEILNRFKALSGDSDNQS